MAPASPLSLLPTMPVDLERVEASLLRVVDTDAELLAEVASHLIRAGGKRVRPGFAIATAAVANDTPQPVDDDVIKGAVAVELVHLGSLYHDDVMDDATTRRNVSSVNARWGNLRAILAGDFLLARASQLAAALGTEVAGLLADTIARLCEGQIREQDDLYNVDRTEESYELSIVGKTASLLASSCRIGGIVGGLERTDVDAVTEFGHSYGIAFQIVDDILDVTATDAQLGKPAGNDLVEGVYTLPVIRALRSPVGPELASHLTRDLGPDSRSAALELIRSSNGVDEALDVARSRADKAASALTALPANVASDALRAAADHLIGRVEARVAETARRSDGRTQH